MCRYALAFLVGILLLLLFPRLPPLAWVWALLFPLLLCLACRSITGALLLAGFAWAWIDAASYLDRLLPQELEREELYVDGCVTGLPLQTADVSRFLFDVTRAQLVTAEAIPLHGRIRLSWYDGGHKLAPGDCGRLKVRLFQPRGMSNPGSSDYERSLFRQNIVAKGYVRTSGVNNLVKSRSSGVDRVRYLLRQTLLAMEDEGQHRALAVYLALVTGDRSLLDKQQWRTFRNTGTSHLMAISGLHIGLVAMLVWWVSERLWRYASSLPLYLPSPLFAAVFALVAALAYAALAGFAIPTVRALLMTAVLVSGTLLRRNTDGLHALGNALLAILLVDPRAVHAAGFWLSFSAVLTILLLHRRYPSWRPWQLVLAIQFALSLVLLPVLAAWGFPASPLAPIVNLVAVPWFSFVIVPAVLIGTLAVMAKLPGNELILELILDVLEVSLDGLTTVSGLAPLVQLPSPGGLSLVIAFAGALLLFLGKGWRMRMAGLPLLAILWWPISVEPFRMTVLDVGQGLSVVIEAGQKVLVYDLGPVYPGGFNTAEAVVRPFLEMRGIDALDMLVISHDDTDHKGGYHGFLEELPAVVTLTGQPDAFPGSFSSCHDYPSWNWRETRFTFLKTDYSGSGDNDYSCVLLIQHPEVKILLTGDITRKAELALMSRYPQLEEIDLLTMPHHGSRTSSGPDFVRFVAARHVIASAGWKNHFGHPAKQVVERWQQAGSSVIETAVSGAVTLVLAAGEGYHLAGHRLTEQRYWRR
ncbi:MAG: DNA internalization-related competence protein ComEC/Rec2 [Chromatiales bacterium]|jgi:competence protein ComEC